MERYVDFWQVTEAALRFAVRRLSIDTTDSQLERLMGAYLNPAAFDEARSALEALEGSALAILSNGSRRMLDSAVRNNGLESYFAEIVSADMVEDLQTVSSRIRPWTRTPESLHAPEILFVSSNLWDAAGAKAFGYPVCWCNRSRSRNGRLGVCSRFYGASA